MVENTSTTDLSYWKIFQKTWILSQPLDPLVVGVEKTPKRRLSEVPRPVDATGALHVPPEAGGRDTGKKRRRTLRLCSEIVGEGAAMTGQGPSCRPPATVATPAWGAPRASGPALRPQGVCSEPGARCDALGTPPPP